MKTRPRHFVFAVCVLLQSTLGFSDCIEKYKLAWSTNACNAAAEVAGLGTCTAGIESGIVALVWQNGGSVAITDPTALAICAACAVGSYCTAALTSNNIKEDLKLAPALRMLKEMEKYHLDSQRPEGSTAIRSSNFEKFLAGYFQCKNKRKPTNKSEALGIAAEVAELIYKGIRHDVFCSENEVSWNEREGTAGNNYYSLSKIFDWACRGGPVAPVTEDMERESGSTDVQPAFDETRIVAPGNQFGDERIIQETEI